MLISLQRHTWLLKLEIFKTKQKSARRSALIDYSTITVYIKTEHIYTYVLVQYIEKIVITLQIAILSNFQL